MKKKPVCYITHACPYYDSGSNKPPNEDVRATVQCVKFLKNCQMAEDIRVFFGEVVACEIKEGGK